MYGPRFYYGRFDPERVNTAAFIALVFWLIILMAGMFWLHSQAHPQPSHLPGVSDGHDRIVFVLFSSVWLFVFFWPAIAGTALCFFLYQYGLLGPRWWIAAAGSFPVALLSYWPAWRLEGHINPEFSFLFAIALSLAFQTVYIAILLISRHLIGRRKDTATVTNS